MAAKATSVYVSIVESATHKTVIHQKFFNSGAANKFVTEQQEKYPKPQYYVVKETY